VHFEIVKRRTPMSRGPAVSTTEKEDETIVEASCQYDGESGFEGSGIP
jgi:hypothetical protein